MEAAVETADVATGGGKSEVKKPSDKFSTVHVVGYIVAAVIARQYSGWQIGLNAGFGSFMIGQVLTAMGCICHYLCLLEIWSAVPFSGGSYALSRATLGFYFGFLDGCMEALVYIGHTSLSALGLGNRICAIFQYDPDYTTLFALCFYALALGITIQGSQITLRRAYCAMALICVIILLVYLLGMLKFVNFEQNASLHRAEPFTNVKNWFDGGWFSWIVILPYTLQPYAGIRSFTLLTSRTENPKVTLPRAVVASFTFIILINILVVFVFVSQPPGISYLAKSKSPLAYGWQLLFGYEGQDNVILTSVLQIPAQFSRVLAYMLPAGVMLQSMGQSNLMPSILCLNGSKDHTNATIVCAIIGMGLLIVYYYYPVIELLNLTVMGTMVTDCTFLYGYILLKTTYSTVPREFTSPFGMAGALFAIAVYILIFISAAFYQSDYFGLEFYACFLAVLSVYYYVFARKTQTLNDEEDHVFFKMHVRNFNMARKTRRRYPCERRRKKSNKVAADAYAPEGEEEELPSLENPKSVTAGDSNLATSIHSLNTAVALSTVAEAQLTHKSEGAAEVMGVEVP